MLLLIKYVIFYDKIIIFLPYVRTYVRTYYRFIVTYHTRYYQIQPIISDSTTWYRYYVVPYYHTEIVTFENTYGT